MGYDDLSVDILWDALMDFEASTKDGEFTSIHEAGHMVVFENIMKAKTMYGWSKGEEGYYPCVILPKGLDYTPTKQLMIDIAGDVCSMIRLGFDVPLLSVAMFRYYKPIQDSDWDSVREMGFTEKHVFDVSIDLKNILTIFWDDVIKEYHVADLFFNMFNRIPQIVELIDRNDRPVLEKLFGVKRSYKYIKKKLLNPETAFEFCKCPNMVK